MTAELALVPKSNSVSIAMPTIPTIAEIDAMNAMCKIAAYSGFLNSTAPRNDTTQRAADAFFVMMYGRELGIPAMTALKTIYVIDGKPSCSGQALLGLMRKGGVEVVIPDPGEVTDRAVVKVKRPGGTWKTYTYTMDMARKAGLENKKNWKSSPAEMLIWRAVSTACRFEAPDIVGGLYTIEELQPDRLVNENGDPLDMPMVSVTNPAPAELPTPEPEEQADATSKSQSPRNNVVESEPPAASDVTSDGVTAIMRADKVKYLGVGNGAYLLFNTEQQSRLYGRDMVRALGDDWKAWVDGLKTGPADQEAIVLPTPLMVTAAEKVKDDGSAYWVVTKLAIEGGAA